jgi:hypothetical protein
MVAGTVLMVLIKRKDRLRRKSDEQMNRHTDVQMEQNRRLSEAEAAVR